MRDKTHQFVLTASAHEGRQPAIHELFSWGLGATRALPGFVDGRLLVEGGDSCGVHLETEWRSQADLERFIRSEQFGRILAGTDDAGAIPKFRSALLELHDLEYVRALRAVSRTRDNDTRGEGQP